MATEATRKESRTPARPEGGGESSQEFVSRIGPIEIDWPRSLGYYGATALGVAAGVIEAPLGVFIAAVPLVKMLGLPRLSAGPRFIAQLFEGASKPVGGDSQGTIRLVSATGASGPPVESAG
jgi:hypothetical protein